MTAITSLLSDYEALFRLAGGLFLIGLGCMILNSTRHPARTATDADQRRSVLGDAGVAYALTMTNPITIIVFVALIASYSSTFSSSAGSAVPLVVGVFVGSMGWWITLASVASLVCGKLNAPWMRRVNLVSGAIIVTFGCIAIATAMR